MATENSQQPRFNHEKWIDQLDPKVERIGVFINESYENIISLIDDGIIHSAQLHGKTYLYI